LKPLKEIRQLQQDGLYQEAVDVANKIKNLSDHMSLLRDICLVLLGKENNPLELLQKYLDLQTDDSSFLADKALAAMIIQKMDIAQDILEKLIDENKADGVVYGRAATVALSNDDLDKAHHYFKEAVFREPGRAQWYNNLAGVLVRQQKLEEALEYYDIALNYKDDFVQAKNSKAQVLMALDRTEDVVNELKANLDKNPDDYELRIRLSRTYHLDNRIELAVKNIGEAIIKLDDIEIIDLEDENAEEELVKIYKAQVAYREYLVDILIETNHYIKALQYLDALEKLHCPNEIFIYTRKLNVFAELKKYDEAKELIEELNNQEDEHKANKHAIASYYAETGEYVEAEKLQRELLETYPGNPALLSALGQTLLWLGKLEEAADLFEEASKINPMALAQMVNAKRYPTDEKSLKLMRDIMDNPFIDRYAKESIGFALSEIYEKQKKYDDAFKYLKIANDFVDKEIKYQPKVFTKRIDHIIEVFSKEYFEQLPPIRKTDRTPIFIVGMPRSGTTLLEQILCSHKDIFGAGELEYISRMAGYLHRDLKVKEPYPYVMKHMTPHLREEAARYYLQSLVEHDKEHRFVVDKMPHNFQHVGLIHAIMPHAKIIHIQRDPRDNAVSNYQQNFKAKHGGLGYAFNLENIANEINAYNKVMQHWRDIGIPMYELTYEELVSNTDTMIREILEFVGVGYDENVKDFHKTERAVRTASVSQVRQPIYATSKQKWKRYEKYLAPFIDNLNPEILEFWDRGTK